MEAVETVVENWIEWQTSRIYRKFFLYLETREFGMYLRGAESSFRSWWSLS